MQGLCSVGKPAASKDERIRDAAQGLDDKRLATVKNQKKRRIEK